MVGERQQCAGHLHAGARCRDTGPARRVPFQSGHFVLQGGGEAREGRRQQLSDPAGAADRLVRGKLPDNIGLRRFEVKLLIKDCRKSGH